MLIDRVEYEGEGGVLGFFIGVCNVLKIYGAVAVGAAVVWALWKVIA